MIKETFPVIGMSCVSCASNIEKALQEIPGIKSVVVNFAVEKATVEFDEKKIISLHFKNPHLVQIVGGFLIN